ncbi:hypothetical protein E2C01_039714 [Portunus trituberculatus]|uniref:Uncharacterized protein n=1 Tax=Portunus trituberculatus TaxID=210409 RepID=A0A5B7FKH5_PORTR|nr:hypothetical protein [Portunus trituberculatus]
MQAASYECQKKGLSKISRFGIRSGQGAKTRPVRNTRYWHLLCVASAAAVVIVSLWVNSPLPCPASRPESPADTSLYGEEPKASRWDLIGECCVGGVLLSVPSLLPSRPPPPAPPPPLLQRHRVKLFPDNILVLP